MVIGKPRGKRGTVPLYIYDPAVKRKRYAGSFTSREVAEGVGQEIEALGLRNCRRCRAKFQPMATEEWLCSPDCVQRFVPRIRKRTRYRKDDHWVYTAFDVDMEIIYVGVTSTGLRRHREHGREMEWWPEVQWIHVEHHDTRDDALTAEADAIARHQPKYNTLGIVKEDAA